MPNLRAVVFDLFGTLTVDQLPAERHRMQEPVAHILGVAPAAFLEVLRDTYTERATGAWGDAAQALQALARRLGADPSPQQLAAAVALRLDAERILASPRPGMLQLLADLRAAGTRVGVLSDCTWEIVSIWPQLPYAALVDEAVFSVVIGARKPSRVMYEAVAGGLAVDPKAVLYVGDGGSNELAGARTAGMHPVLLRGSLTEPADVRALRYDAEDNWTGEHVRDAAELRRLPATLQLLGLRSGLATA